MWKYPFSHDPLSNEVALLWALKNVNYLAAQHIYAALRTGGLGQTYQAEMLHCHCHMFIRTDDPNCDQDKSPRRSPDTGDGGASWLRGEQKAAEAVHPVKTGWR